MTLRHSRGELFIDGKATGVSDVVIEYTDSAGPPFGFVRGAEPTVIEFDLILDKRLWCEISRGRYSHEKGLKRWRGDHRRWMTIGRALAKLDYTPIQQADNK